MRDPCPSRRELYVTPRHRIKQLLVRALTLSAERRVAVRQLAAEDVAEDLGIAVWVGGEARPRSDTVFVQDPNRAEVLDVGTVVVWEVEAAVAAKPAGV